MSNAEHQRRWREREAAKLPPPGPLTADDVFASVLTEADVLRAFGVEPIGAATDGPTGQPTVGEPERGAK
jgi:hypothetical protein